ncbi:MAG: FAD-dependent oxidoreductase [Synergistaceae bacterium]|nr:FAD-dependent oxidoreductase [Synergistaceae bacterium]
MPIRMRECRAMDAGNTERRRADMMEGKIRVVIIGGVACGAKTAARLARICPNAEITILERGDDLSYANCGFPFLLGGEVKNRDLLTHTGFGVERNSDYFENYALTKALTGHEVINIDRVSKNVTAKIKATGETVTFPYDKLVISTGASPIIPNVPGVDLKNVFTLWTLKDALAINNVLANSNIKKAAVIGAGLVGIETAEALKHKGIDVTMIDALPLPLYTIIGEEFGPFIIKELESNGIKFYGSEKLIEIRGEKFSSVSGIVTDKREFIEADLVVMSVGVRPNLALAESAGLSIGARAILTDECMRTSDPDIYAGGDSVECLSSVTNKRVWQPMGSTANRHGRVIADNIAGLDSKFTGAGGTAIVRVFGYSAGKTGLTFKAAEEAGFDPIEMLSANPDIPGFMPGSSMILIKLVADIKTRRVLGAQMIGTGRIDKRLDVITTAIKGNLTIDSLADADLAYSPPYATALDPVTHAANSLRNKMDGLIRSLPPSELKAKGLRGDDFTILDVRSREEVKRFGKLKYNWINIPLGELVTRAEELPKDKEMIIVCRSAVRAWSAYSMLLRHGFTKMEVLEGGMVSWGYEIEKLP